MGAERISSFGATETIQAGAASHPTLLQDGVNLFVAYDDGIHARSNSCRVRVAKLSLADVIAAGEGATITTTIAISGS